MTDPSEAALDVLASYLVEGLRGAMPPGIELSAQGRFIHISGDPAKHLAGLSYFAEYPREEALPFAAESALDELQDRLSRHTTEPWPVDPAGKVALPFAEIHGADLVWGYGSARQPVVNLPPLPLSALSSGRGDAA